MPNPSTSNHTDTTLPSTRIKAFAKAIFGEEGIKHLSLVADFADNVYTTINGIVHIPQLAFILGTTAGLLIFSLSMPIIFFAQAIADWLRVDQAAHQDERDPKKEQALIIQASWTTAKFLAVAALNIVATLGLALSVGPLLIAAKAICIAVFGAFTLYQFGKGSRAVWDLLRHHDQTEEARASLKATAVKSFISAGIGLSLTVAFAALFFVAATAAPIVVTIASAAVILTGLACIGLWAYSNRATLFSKKSANVEEKAVQAPSLSGQGNTDNGSSRFFIPYKSSIQTPINQVSSKMTLAS